MELTLAFCDARDIKCANILVDTNGRIKVADFGLAKQVSTYCFISFVPIHSLFFVFLLPMYSILGAVLRKTVLKIIAICVQISKLDELKSCKGSAYWMAPEVSFISFDSCFFQWTSLSRLFTQSIFYDIERRSIFFPS